MQGYSMILTAILERSAVEFKNKSALTMKMGYRTLSLSYNDVHKKAHQIAHFLASKGLNKGDRIIIIAPNSPQWICLFWGALLQGIVLVPLSIQSTTTFIESIATQTSAKLLFIHRFLNEKLNTTIPHVIIDFLFELIDKQPANPLKAIIKPDDIVQIMYTSGTTGDPKGVVLTHKNLFSNIASITAIYPPPQQTTDRILSILPLSHIFEQSIGFLFPFSAGAHIIYTHSYAAIRPLMQQHCITKMIVVPEFLKVFMSKILDEIEQKKKTKLLTRLLAISNFFNYQPLSRLLFHRIRKNLGGCLDIIACGGAPLDPLLEQQWYAMGITILQGYGLTETSPLVTTNIPQQHRFGSVGKTVPQVNVHCDDDDEILVKGPNVFTGYFDNPTKTSEAFTTDGWFKTGDIGNFDKDGFLYLKGRKKYMIKGPGGQNIFPEDIEQVLNEQPAVQDSCVLGIDQPSGFTLIHAALLLKNQHDHLTASTIIEHANSRLSSLQHIASWSIWPEADFPRSATKKIKKETVKKFIQEKHTASSIPTATYDTPLTRLLANLGEKPLHDFTPTTPLSQLPLDSLMRIELLLRIEETFGLLLDESKIIPSLTVGELATMIEKHETGKPQPRLKQWPRARLITIIRTILQYPLFWLSRIFARTQIEGLEHLKNLSGPVIFMPNHISYFDFFALIKALPLHMRTHTAFAAGRDVLYEEFWYLSFLGDLLFNTFPFPRKEDEHIKFGLDAIGSLLDQQFNVVLFPEGKISKDGSLQPLKQGAGLVAVEMGVPIVPVKITGSEKIFPFEKILPRTCGAVNIKFGKPLIFTHKTGYEEVTQHLEAALKHL